MTSIEVARANANDKELPIVACLKSLDPKRLLR